MAYPLSAQGSGFEVLPRRWVVERLLGYSIIESMPKTTSA